MEESNSYRSNVIPEKGIYNYICYGWILQPAARVKLVDRVSKRSTSHDPATNINRRGNLTKCIRNGFTMFGLIPAFPTADSTSENSLPYRSRDA